MAQLIKSASLYLKGKRLYGMYNVALLDGRVVPYPEIIAFGEVDFSDHKQLFTILDDLLSRPCNVAGGDDSWYVRQSYDASARLHGCKTFSVFTSDARLVNFARDGETVHFTATKRHGKRSASFTGTEVFATTITHRDLLADTVRSAFSRSI